MIELVNVSKVYRADSGEVRALDDVTLSVAPGEFVTVRGPSGSGKSTLLLTIGGMIRPTEGRVLTSGQDVYMMSSRQRARLRADTIGFVFQMFYLVPYLSALENVLVPYKLLENRELLLRSGFRYVDTFFKWYNFSAMVAVK